MNHTPPLSFYEDTFLAGIASLNALIWFNPLLYLNESKLTLRAKLHQSLNWKIYRYSFTGYFPRIVPQQALNIGLKNHISRALNYQPEVDGYIRWSLANLFSGGSAGGLALCLTYPVDFVRSRLYNDFKKNPQGLQRRYQGPLDVLRKTLASDGIAGLYRGFVVTGTQVFCHRALLLGLYDSGKPLLGYYSSDLIPSFLFGSFVSAFSLSLTSPLEILRKQTLMKRSTNQQIRTYRVAFDLWKSSGLKGFFIPPRHFIGHSLMGAGFLVGYDYLSRLYIHQRLQY